MNPPPLRQPKTLFVLADGGHARLVERSAETGAFVTFEEMTAADIPHARRGPAPGLGVDDATARHDKEAFAAEVSARAMQICAARGIQRISVSAPARLVGVFRIHLARSTLQSEVVERDLARTPDRALGRWLSHLPSA